MNLPDVVPAVKLDTVIVESAVATLPVLAIPVVSPEENDDMVIVDRAAATDAEPDDEEVWTADCIEVNDCVNSELIDETMAPESASGSLYMVTT